MKVADIMTRRVETCAPETSLTEAARRMSDAWCGVLPVVDAGGKVVGIVTDRDISMALTTTARKPINVRAREAMSLAVHTCRAGDDVQSALRTMQEFRVRRLPVIATDGRLEGILSIDDVILRALAPDAPTPDDVVQSLREILTRRAEALELTADVTI